MYSQKVQMDILKVTNRNILQAIYCGRFNFTRLTYTVVYSNREGCSQNYCVFAAIKEKK